MTTILNGLLGGLLVGLVGAITTRFATDDSWTASALRINTGGTESPPSRWVGLFVQLVYGGCAGGILVALELYLLGMLAVPPSTGESFGLAIAWSAVLFWILTVAWRVASPETFDRSHLGGLLVYHLVYGIGLGLWIRLTWIT